MTKNVPDFGLIVGNPGKLVAWVNEKGDKIKFHEIKKDDFKNY